MTEKSLGQVAYEAYLGIGEEHAGFANKEHEAAWEAAAQAVEREVYARHQALPPSTLTDAEKAVVEAAVRVVAASGQWVTPQQHWIELKLAVEALQKERE